MQTAGAGFGENTMKTSKALFTSLIMLGLLCISGIAAAQQDTTTENTTGLADSIQPYEGPIGADSPLYGLKIAMENIDESFTSNQSERVNKQLDHAQLRIAEVRRALELNQSDSADHALELYWQKMNLTETTIAPFGPNATGLFHAQEQMVKHQVVLEKLLIDHPNNTGLQRAYNNSFELEHKFEEKTDIRFNRTREDGNLIFTREFGLGQKDMERHGNQTGSIQSNETISRPGGLDQKDMDSHGKQTGSIQPNETFSRPSGLDQKDMERHGNQTGSIQSNETSTRPSVAGTHGQQNGGETNKDNPAGTTTTTSRPTPSVTPSVTQAQQHGQQPPVNQQNGNSGNADNKGKSNSQNR
jgi:hypothetical protein